MSNEALALYADMGATPVINALGNRTFLGGSAPDPEVVAAMQMASRYYVNMDELLASTCLLYTSPSPRDRQKSRMPSSA